ncbi:hypothetical protein [Methylobacterium sp. CM6257]
MRREALVERLLPTKVERLYDGPFEGRLDEVEIAPLLMTRRAPTRSGSRALLNPGCADRSVGTRAFGCGFASQAHFSRRFRDRSSLSPRPYRQIAPPP